MFLAYLRDNDKKAFLDLAYLFVLSDDHFSEEEKSILSLYKNEMMIDFMYFDDDISYDSVLGDVSDDIVTKKIILLELIGLALADNKYSDKERNFILKLSEDFGISSDAIDGIEEAVKEAINASKHAQMVVLSE